MAKAIRNTTEMRNFLIEQMQRLISGELDSVNAKVICNFSQQIYNMTNLEIRYAQTQAKVGDMRLKPVGFSAGSLDSTKR